MVEHDRRDRQFSGCHLADDVILEVDPGRSEVAADIGTEDLHVTVDLLRTPEGVEVYVVGDILKINIHSGFHPFGGIRHYSTRAEAEDGFGVPVPAVVVGVIIGQEERGLIVSDLYKGGDRQGILTDLEAQVYATVDIKLADFITHNADVAVDDKETAAEEVIK